VRVEIWSDIVCPWCYIGKRRFELALSGFEQRDAVEVLYRSYELDPNAPRSSGLDNYARLARKYGMTIEQARERSAQVAEAGAQDGLVFDFDNVKQSNSFDAHRVVQLAAAHGLQAEAMERLHRLYFSEGALLADTETLVEAAADIGLSVEETRAMLADPRAFADEVRADERLAGQFGLSGVPAFVIDRKYLISGAQPSEHMLAALQQAWSESAAAVGD
jgi:predicted DsbA family dithiol-disulfide isomerase